MRLINCRETSKTERQVYNGASEITVQQMISSHAQVLSARQVSKIFLTVSLNYNEIAEKLFLLSF